MQDHARPSDSALIQELASTRAALRTAIGIGERLQARIDAAILLAAQSESAERYAPIVAVLRGQS